jgi:anti-sigma regulatory factor (Ser/Thr protein kinase)
MVQERQSASPFDQRRVYFRSLVTAEKTQFTIRDNGPGFDTSKIPAATDPDSFRDGTGRGLVLIQSAMDEVTFDESGNELVMTKYGSKSPTLPR